MPGAQSLEAGSTQGDDEAHTLRNLVTDGDRRRRLGISADELRAEEVAAVVEAFDSLPSDLQVIAGALMAGRTVAAIARDMGISRRQARNAIERVRQHFEAAGFGDS